VNTQKADAADAGTRRSASANAAFAPVGWGEGAVPGVFDVKHTNTRATRGISAIKGRGWLIRRALLLADLTGLTTALFLAQVFTLEGTGGHRLTPTVDWLFFLVSLPAWVVAAKLYRLYDRDEERTDHSTVDDVVGVSHLVSIAVWLAYIVGAWTSLFHPDLDKLFAFWVFAVFLIPIMRVTARAVCRRRPEYLQNTVIIGAGDVGQRIARKYLQHPEYGINLIGFLDAMPKERRPDLGHVTLLGSPDQLREIVDTFDVERVVIAFSNHRHDELLDLIRSLSDYRVQIDVVPRLFEVVGPRVGLHGVEGVPLVGLPPLALPNSSRLLKRTMDLVVASTALVLLFPLFVVVAALIKLTSRGPVFFRQARMGANDRTFRIFKFRTMVIDADERKDEVAHLNKHLNDGGDPRMFKIPGDPRATSIGRFLRKFAIDELPQLLNVVKGEMSLVGPRPLILDEDQHVSSWGRRRLDIKPGITGAWQILGRTNIPFDEMVNLDYLYVTGWSLLNDCKLLLRTAPAVLRTRADA
jgi:exopolysaccharide biosynthesis polyprenyl glycosylphosphotransferase